MRKATAKDKYVLINISHPPFHLRISHKIIFITTLMRIREVTGKKKYMFSFSIRISPGKCPNHENKFLK